MSASPCAAATPDWQERLGLCSVTLRRQPVGPVLEAAAAAGLRRIEWGADVHAPPVDLAVLDELAAATRRSGLTVASYGTYWRAGVHDPAEVVPLVAAANRLGAPRLRVWAGDAGTDEADVATWDGVVGGLREACAVARREGVQLALEFHPGTLTDTVDSTLELLDRVGDEVLGTYWQPRLDEPAEPSVAGLRRLLPVLRGVHVFSWWPEATRLDLTARSDLWTTVLDTLFAESPPVDLLLEFVRDDDPAQLVRDAATLRTWVGGSAAPR